MSILDSIGGSSPSFSNANCSGGGPLDPAFLERIRRPDWRPSEHLPAGLRYDHMDGTDEKPRKKRASYACKRCGVRFTLPQGGHPKYCRPCADEVEEERVARNIEAKREKRLNSLR